MRDHWEQITVHDTHIHMQTVECASESELSQLREIVSKSLILYFILLGGMKYLSMNELTSE
jgi:hypothetical protein